MDYLDALCLAGVLAGLILGWAGRLAIRQQCRNLPEPETKLDGSGR
jgi:hypothetical protein